ncbi:MAG: hypothetical protein ACI9R3_003528 [Verrucomicrobiales bacterium]|jgi:hypothetical protein
MKSFRIIPALAFVIFGGCSGNDCDNEVSQELRSPDGSVKVALFSRNCGATAGFNTQATLLKSEEDLSDEPGNVFIIDQGEAQIAWEDSTTLLVRISPGAQVFKQESKVRGISVKYVTLPIEER